MLGGTNIIRFRAIFLDNKGLHFNSHFVQNRNYSVFKCLD
jgi:hypothetical protein